MDSDGNECGSVMVGDTFREDGDHLVWEVTETRGEQARLVACASPRGSFERWEKADCLLASWVRVRHVQEVVLREAAPWT